MKPYLLLVGLATVVALWFVDAAASLIYLPVLLAVVLASLWPVGGHPHWKRPDWRFEGFLVGWAFYMFASMSWSGWPQASFWLSIVVACIPLVCLAGSRHFQSPVAWNFIRWLMFGTALGFAGWLLLEFYASGGRSDGPLRDANAAAALINLFLLPALWVVWAPSTRGSERLRNLLLIAFLGAALFSTGSRGAMLALAGASVISFAVLLLCRLPFNRRGLVGAVLAFSVGVAAVHVGPQAPLERNMTNLAGDSSLNARLLIWRSTWSMYQDNPFLGVGFGAFAVSYPEYRSPLEPKTAGTFAHNDYLQFLAEGGVPLLAMLLVFGLANLYWGGVLLRRGGVQQGRLEHYEGLGLVAAIAAMFTHAGVNFIFYVAPLALWIGIYAGRARALSVTIDAPSQDGSLATTPEFYRPARLLFGVIGTLAAVLLATDIVSYYALSRDRLSDDSYQVNSNRFQTALAITYINPINTHARDYLIRAQTKLALENQDAEYIGRTMAEAALTDVERIVEILHASCAPRVLQARLLTAFPPVDKQLAQSPDRVLEQTLKERPDCLQATLALAEINRDRRDLAGALSVLEAGNEWLHLTSLDKGLRLKVLEQTARIYLELGRPQQALYISMVVLNNDPESTDAQWIRTEAERRLQGDL